MDLPKTKSELVKFLLESSHANTESPEWSKNPSKIKPEMILEEAAKAIAKRKLEIQNIADEK